MRAAGRRGKGKNVWNDLETSTIATFDLTLWAGTIVLVIGGGGDDIIIVQVISNNLPGFVPHSNQHFDQEAVFI